MSSLGSLGSLVVSLEANMAKFESDMGKAARVAENFQQSVENVAGMASKALAGIGVVAGVAAFKGLIDGAIEAQASLKSLSERTGATVESLSGLRSVAKLSGTDMEAVATGLQKLSKTMNDTAHGGETTQAAFRAIGISAKEVAANMDDPGKMMMLMAQRMEGFRDGAGKTAVMMALMGKSGANLGEMMHDMAEEGKLTASVTTEMAAAADEYQKNLTRWDNRMKIVYSTIAGEMVPVMNDFMVAMMASDEKTKTMTKASQDLAKNGSIKEWAQSGAKAIGFLIDVADGVVRVFQAAGATLGALAAKAAIIYDGLGNIMHGKVDEIPAKWKAMNAQLESVTADTKTNLENIWGRAQFSEKLAAQFERSAQSAKKFGDDAQKPLVDFNANAEKSAAAVDALQKSFDSAMNAMGGDNAKLQAQIDWMDKYGVSVAFATEALIQFEVTQGKFKNLPDAQKAQLIDAAKLKDQLEAAKKQAEEFYKYAEQLRQKDQEDEGKYQVEKWTTIHDSTASLMEEAQRLNVEMIGDDRERAYAQLDIEKQKWLKIISLAQEGSDERKAIEEQYNNWLNAKMNYIDFQKWKQTADSINQSLTDALLRGFESGKGFAENFVSTLKNMFKTLVLKPVISFIMNPISQAITGGLASMGIPGMASAAGGGAMGNLGGSLLGNLGGSLVGNSAVYGMGVSGLTMGGEQAAMLAAQTGEFGMAGLSATSAAAGGGLMSTIGAALPWIGGGLLLASLFSKPGGGPKTEGNAFGTIGLGGALDLQHSGTSTVPTAFFGDGDWLRAGSNAGAVESLLKPIGTSIAGYITKLGGSATGLGFGLGYNTDPQGKAPDNVSAVVTGAAGETLYRKTYDTERGGAQAAMQDELQKMTLAAIQAVDLGPILTPLMDGLGQVGDMTKDQVSATLTAINSIGPQTAESVQKVFGEAFDIKAFSALSREGENTVQTFARLSGVFNATNGVAEMLGQDAKTAFGAVGLASADMRQSLIDGAGGMDAFTQQAGAYYQGFYSETERSARALTSSTDQINNAFARMGVAVPTSTEAFRALVEGLDLSTDSGQAMYQALMKIAPTFAQVADASKNAINSISQSLDTLHGNHANSQMQAQMSLDTAMAAVTAAMPWITSFKQLTSMTMADAQNYSAANQQLIAAALSAGTALNGFTSSVSAVNPAIQNLIAARSDPNRINRFGGPGTQTVDEYAASIINPLLAHISDAFGRSDPALTLTMQEDALRRVIDDAASRMDAARLREQSGVTYGPSSVAALEAQIRAAQAALDRIATSRTYDGHGLEVADLNEWYRQQKEFFRRNGLSTTDLDAEYQRRLDAILASGTAAATHSATSIVDAMKKTLAQIDALKSLSDGVGDAINVILAAQGNYAAAIDTANDRLVAARQKLASATGIDEQTRAANELKNAIMARYNAEAAEIKRIQGLIDQITSLSEGISGSIQSIKASMKGYDGVAYATTQVDKYRTALSGATTTEEQITAAGKLKDAIMGRYTAEMAELQKRRDAENEAGKAAVDAANEAGRAAVDAANKLNAAFRSIGEYAKGLLVGTSSSLNAAERMAEVQRQYNDMLSRARGGDADAAGKLQGLADNLLGQNKDAAGTSLEYARSFAQVQGALAELGSRAGADKEFKPQVYAEDTSKWEAETLRIQNSTIAELEALNAQTLVWQDQLKRSLPSLEALQSATLDELRALNTTIDDWQTSLTLSLENQATAFAHLNLTATDIANALNGLDSRIAAIITAAIATRDALSRARAPAAEPLVNYIAPPGFASGGDHVGGWRVVGENGPELEYTPPSHIYNNNDSRKLLSNEEVVSELRQLRADMRAANSAVASNTQETAKMLRRWNGDGMPEVRVVA